MSVVSPTSWHDWEVRAVAAARAFHESWGQLDMADLDPLALWEDLGRILYPKCAACGEDVHRVGEGDCL